MRELLNPLGFLISEAASGAQRLEQIAADSARRGADGPADAGIFGVRSHRALRAQPQFSELPILAVSASAFQDQKPKALAAGCDAHVAKPVILAELLEELGRFLPLEWRFAHEPEEISPRGRPLTSEEHHSLMGMVRTGTIMQIQETLTKMAQQAEPPKKIGEMLAAARRFNLKRVRVILEASSGS